MEVGRCSLDERTCVRLAELVGAWKRPLLLTHMRADGDAVGALFALRSVLAEGGASPQAVLFEPPARRCSWLLQDDPLDVFVRRPSGKQGTESPAFTQADAVILLDTCAYAQIEPVADWLRRSPLPKLAVDHHVTRDAAVDHYLVDETASATCLILYEWARAAGWTLAADARTALYVGIATDTGWFRFANTDARTLEAAAALVGAGISPAAVFEKVYQNESVARFRLLGAAINGVELHCGDRLAVMPLTRELFARTRASQLDTEDLVNYPLEMATVEVSVLLVEQADGLVRASFRSKPPSEDSARASQADRRGDIDVSAVAAEFGGGGHRRAAAARLAGTLEGVKQTVIERFSASWATLPFGLDSPGRAGRGGG